MSPSANTKMKTSSSPERKNRRRHVFRACTKHSDHSTFCPVHRLTSQHFINDGLRCASAVQHVRGIARLVVRVRVLAGSEAGEGLRQQRTCSGVLTSVNEDDVTVMVPLHSVQGDVQVVDTTADFFHDSEDNSDNIVTVKGKSLVRHDLQHVAQLTCHNRPELKQRFQQRREEDMALTLEALMRRPDSESKRRRIQGSEVVLISHPHGFSKRVTFGKVCGKEVVKRRVSDDQTFCEFWDDDDDDDGDDDVTLRSSGQRGSLLSMSDAVVTSASSPSSSSLSSQLSSLALLSSEPLLLTQTTEKQENASGTATLLWSKILRLCCSGPATLWARIVSLCSDFFRVLDSFRQILLDFSDEDSSEIVRIYHTCASCPGSSGGAVIAIGCPGFSRLDESVTSLPVYLHVGVREGQGVAVPVSVSRGALNLCFGGDPGKWLCVEE